MQTRRSKAAPLQNLPAFDNITYYDGRHNPPRDISDDPDFVDARNIIRDGVAHVYGSKAAQKHIKQMCGDIAQQAPAKRQFKKKDIQTIVRTMPIRFVVQRLNTNGDEGSNEEAGAGGGMADGREASDADDEDGIPWGFVDKGETDPDVIAQNRIYLSNELIDAVCGLGAPDSLSPQEKEALQLKHELILLTAVLHELPHALLKILFAPNLITPVVGYIMPEKKRQKPGEDRCGELGWTLERYYCGFILEVWASKIEKKQTPGRMWRIHSLGGSHDSLVPCQFDLSTIRAIVESYRTQRIHTPRLGTEAKPLPTDFHLAHMRLRACSSLSEEDEPEPVNQSTSELVHTNNCGTRRLSRVGGARSTEMETKLRC